MPDFRYRSNDIFQVLVVENEHEKSICKLPRKHVYAIFDFCAKYIKTRIHQNILVKSHVELFLTHANSDSRIDISFSDTSLRAMFFVCSDIFLMPMAEFANLLGPMPAADLADILGVITVHDILAKLCRSFEDALLCEGIWMMKCAQ